MGLFSHVLSGCIPWPCCMLAALDRGWKNFRRLRAENRLALHKMPASPRFRCNLRGPPGHWPWSALASQRCPHATLFSFRELVHHKNADRLVIFLAFLGQSLFVHSFFAGAFDRFPAAAPLIETLGCTPHLRRPNLTSRFSLWLPDLAVVHAEVPT